MFLTGFLLLSVLSTGYAIRCYTCDNKETPACGRDFKAYQFEANVCLGEKPMKCGKQEQAPNKDGWVGTIRNCYETGSLQGANDSNGCHKWLIPPDNYTALLCFCDEDYCNGASPILGSDPKSDFQSRLLYAVALLIALLLPSSISVTSYLSNFDLKSLIEPVMALPVTRTLISEAYGAHDECLPFQRKSRKQISSAVLESHFKDDNKQKKLEKSQKDSFDSGAENASTKREAGGEPFQRSCTNDAVSPVRDVENIGSIAPVLRQCKLFVVLAGLFEKVIGCSSPSAKNESQSVVDTEIAGNELWEAFKKRID